MTHTLAHKSPQAPMPHSYALGVVNLVLVLQPALAVMLMGISQASNIFLQSSNCGNECNALISNFPLKMPCIIAPSNNSAVYPCDADSSTLLLHSCLAMAT
jgi:hypothetical protein